MSGSRSVWGAVIGACVIGLMPDLLADLEKWRFVIYGLILLLILMFVPQGILLGMRDLVRWASAKLKRETGENDAAGSQ